MDVNVPQLRSVVCRNKREPLVWFSEKVYRTQVRRPFNPVILGRANGSALCAADGANPESRTGAPCVCIPGSHEDATRNDGQALTRKY
jgi:hypothetical protein